MFMVLLKTNVDMETHVCNFAPKLIEIDHGKPLAEQFREHLECERFASMEVDIDGTPYTIVVDADGAKSNKVPSYCVSDERIVFGNVLFGHRGENFEVVGIEEEDAIPLVMHLLENTAKMNDLMKHARDFGTEHGLI